MDNADVEYTGIDYGSTATYKCKTGYTMKGNDTITCEASGKWTKNGPSCKEEKGKYLTCVCLHVYLPYTHTNRRFKRF